MSLYTLTGLTRRFGGREVLRIDALTIEPGRIYALLGPNGAGKTTLMKLLSFMDTPTSGDIVFQGEAVRPEDAARHRAKVVWVPQSPVMFTGTLRYNVEYPMRLKGVPAAERKSRAGELMRAVNLERLAESPAHSLSGGEAQRASIARALAAGAQAILFDEPTASVDHRSRGDLINLIRDLWKDRGLSLLVTTHDARLAAELCHEHIFLMDGRVVPQTLLSDSAAAWPAGLRTENGRPVLSLPPQAREALFGGREAPRTDFPALAVSGLAELAAGVSLRLSPPRGNPVDVLLSDGVSRECARRLSLGDAVHLEAQ